VFEDRVVSEPIEYEESQQREELPEPESFVKEQETVLNPFGEETVEIVEPEPQKVDAEPPRIAPPASRNAPAPQKGRKMPVPPAQAKRNLFPLPKPAEVETAPKLVPEAESDRH
jgi:hypothetical protein